MPILRLNRSYWLNRTAPPPDLPQLDRPLVVDVAIVGGGFIGTLTAWMLANAGLRVGLVEAQRIGYGSTAASSALLMQEPDRDFAELTKRFGPRRARRIWKISVASVTGLIRTLRELDIRCELSPRESIYYATRADAGRRLRAEYQRRTNAGFQCSWLDRLGLQRTTGIDGAGAIVTRGNGQVDPYRACLGLARAARQMGARLFERSPAQRIEPHRHGVTVVTRNGRLEADRVIVATGYATPFFRPLNADFQLKNTYVIVTRRITARERRVLCLGEVMLWDTARPYHYARWTPDHRLMFGGGDRPRLTGLKRVAAFRSGVASLRHHLERLLPGLGDIDIDFAWEGMFAMTADGLPYIGPHDGYPGHLFALGYGGNGMTFGFLAARLLLDTCCGRRTSDQSLFGFDR